jgi:hypothetical protein
MLNTYRRPILALLPTLGEQPEGFEATALRPLVLDRAGRGGIGCAKTLVKAVRMCRHLLLAVSRGPPGRDQALPTLAHGRLASWPRDRPPETVERVLASCDLTTPIGVRERAVLLLLAR